LFKVKVDARQMDDGRCAMP